MFFGFGAPEVRDLVPPEYDLLTDPVTERPVVRVAGGRCDAVTLPGDSPRPLTWALMDVALVPPDGRAGPSSSPVVGDVKGDAVPLGTWYTNFMAFDDQAVVEWAREGTPDYPVEYVEALSFESGSVELGRAGAPFRLQAGAPAPSPFTYEGVARQRPIEHPLTALFWRNGSYGTATLVFEAEDFAFGEVDGTLRAAANSEMDRMFGSSAPALAPGWSQFGAAEWSRAEFRKEISRPAFARECHERAFVGPGHPDLVRAAVPERYQLVVNSGNMPLLFVSGVHCEQFWPTGGTPRPVTFAAFQAIIESPDGSGCQSSTPGIRNVKGDALFDCNWYPFWRAFDDPAVVEWFRDGTPEWPAYYVPDLSFEQADLDPSMLGAAFRFEAGPSAPSPFELDAVVREQPIAAAFSGGWWWDGPQGTVKITLELDDLAFGDGDVTLRPGPGSDMAEMLGTEPEPEPGYSQLLGGFHWGRVRLLKEIVV